MRFLETSGPTTTPCICRSSFRSGWTRLPMKKCRIFISAKTEVDLYLSLGGTRRKTGQDFVSDPFILSHRHPTFAVRA